MRTIKLVIAYDGTNYSGWQKQKNAPTIQEKLERAVSMICNTETVVHSAGRTDSGVHALAMAAHFKTNSRVSCDDLQRGLNSLLPAAIRILAASGEPADFHARYSALAKTYRYTIFTGPILCPHNRLYTLHVPYQLSIAPMRDCLAKLIGEHDFSSFEKTGSRDKSRENSRGAVRTLFRAELEQPEPSIIHFNFTGDGFLRHMVRSIVGTILEIGSGKQTVEAFARILASKDRNKAGTTAASCGLHLVKVHYKQDWQR